MMLILQIKAEPRRAANPLLSGLIANIKEVSLYLRNDNDKKRDEMARAQVAQVILQA